MRRATSRPRVLEASVSHEYEATQQLLYDIPWKQQQINSTATPGRQILNQWSFQTFVYPNDTVFSKWQKGSWKLHEQRQDLRSDVVIGADS